MKKEYVLIESEKYKLIISFEEEDFDYYVDVYIKLIIGGKSKILFKDNLLALKNIMAQYNENVDSLNANLDEDKLGVLLNDYYRGVYENHFQDTLILDNQEGWIGEKYCCFCALGYATWIYRYDGNIIMKVTPVFGGLEEDDYVQEYDRFIQAYNDVFREVISLQQLIYMKKIIFELYDELFN